jgi:hypothetical protein
MKTPHEIGTGEKPDLSAVRPWGCKAWVKRVGVGKLEPRAEECRFVGIDDEAKGYRIYWPGKNRVSVKRNVYFNESEALEPEEAPVEGENDGLTNSNHPFNSNTSRNNPESLQPVDNAPNMSNETHKPENIENTPEICPEMNQTLPETPIPLAPHQRPKRRNSLTGLPQYDENSFGRGKRQCIATSRASASAAEVVGVEEAFAMEENRVLEPGGVELNIGEGEMEHAMALSEDEPSLTEALGGNERSAWFDAVDAELSQMEKVNAWIPVTPPRDANIIPSRYVFRRKRNGTGNIVRYKARLVVKGF